VGDHHLALAELQVIRVGILLHTGDLLTLALNVPVNSKNEKSTTLAT
jgi:hypothetical protein